MTYVVPPAPVEGDDLDDVLQAMIVGITGLEADLVRPRWQPVVPKQPEPGTDWCSIGVVSSTPDANAYVQHLSGISISQPAGDLSQRHEDLEVLVSFYGPNAKAPEFINQQWIRRWDSAISFRRMVARAYLVNNILSAEIDLKDDTGHIDRVVNVPPDGR
jgi:hypothetical protein